MVTSNARRSRFVFASNRKRAFWVLSGGLAWLFAVIFFVALSSGVPFAGGKAWKGVEAWKMHWPDTDFTKHDVPLFEIVSGGLGKDGIPAIDKPRFAPITEIHDIAPTEPVITVTLGGRTKGYPLRVLIWHEIVNDTIGGVPILVTYCPLCNTAIVFKRNVDGHRLDFGTTGKLRNSDLVMYDRQSQSWWQQFMGRAIVGAMTGRVLEALPSRLESFADLKRRVKDARILVPNTPGFRRYGTNPYINYDTARVPFLYQGDLPKGIDPMARVVAIGDRAWSLNYVRRVGHIETHGLVISWHAGQNSALDARRIASGRDVGSIVAQRRGKDGRLRDVVHTVTFAFAFHAFFPDKNIVTR